MNFTNITMLITTKMLKYSAILIPAFVANVLWGAFIAPFVVILLPIEFWVGLTVLVVALYLAVEDTDSWNRTDPVAAELVANASKVAKIFAISVIYIAWLIITKG